MPPFARTIPIVTLSAWLACGLALLAAAVTLAQQSWRYSYDFLVVQMPVFPFVWGYMAAGAVFVLAGLLTWRLIGRGATTPALVAVMVVLGLAMRLALMTSEPVLEDDYQRYLWDGGVTVAGFNPYAYAPSAATAANAPPELAALARAAEPVPERINHADLRTIYPPVAQAAFAVAHLISPWSLSAWRVVCLAGEIATISLILALLGLTGRSLLWATLYWWNPLVIKELINSAHMEAVLLPLLLGALYLAARHRHVAASAVLALAAGVKLWPVLLMPLVLRPLLGRPARLAMAGAVAGVICAALAVPVLVAGLDETSGFVAYAAKWQTNSALFPALADAVARLQTVLGLEALAAGALARGLIALVLGGLALGLAIRPAGGPGAIMGRAATLVGTLVVLSPAQFPWYAVWFTIFLPFFPVWGFMALTVTMPLYYTAFHYMAHATLAPFKAFELWLLWVPVWVLLTAEGLFRLASRQPGTSGTASEENAVAG